MRSGDHGRRILLSPSRTIPFIIAGLCYCSTMIGQQSNKRPEEFDLLHQEKAAMGLAQPSGVALESTVDPARYFVGPSDMIAVNIWMSPPLNFPLTVTPEGTLIIPTVGEVKVSDLSLAEAKERILKEVRRKYLTAQVTATLLKPRPIIVAVTGNVLNQGLYTLSAVDRANKAIEEANKPARLQREEMLAPILQEMSMRNIVLKHKDGSQSRVDITKFLATKSDELNPYLREGDVVVVPRKNRAKNVFGIYGEVNSPGRYEFVEGDSLLDAIRIGQGFTRLARTDSVEFSRLSLDGAKLSTRVMNLATILETQQPNFALEPGDRIIVKAKNDLREDYRVRISGEVVHPGTYPITKDGTRLAAIIREAGGLTEYAALKSASLNRRSVEPEEVATERLLSFRGGVSFEDSSDYILETELRLRREVVNVDFEKLYLYNDSTQDVVLQDEDVIVIPSLRKTIYVFGQIVSPGHIPFVRGKQPDYYIEKAGGFTERARTDDMRIIKSRTKQWLEPDETPVEEGDYIWVPKEPDRPFSYYMTVASQAASVLSVVVGIAVVIVQVSK